MQLGAEVLCIEDDAHIGHLLRLHLGELGCGVEWVSDGAEGLARALENRFDLILLDLMLPSLDGLEVCRQMRQRNCFTPVVMLSAKADKRDIVCGLEVGADEYITKPFSAAELGARLQALLRRIAVEREQRADGEQMFRCCGFQVDPPKREIRRNGEVLVLTAKEFDLLLFFARSPGRVFSRGEILNAIWGAEFDGYDHTVNTHINRLRNKVEPDPANPSYIQTVWGVGYRFADTPGERH